MNKKIVVFLFFVLVLVGGLIFIGGRRQTLDISRINANASADIDVEIAGIDYSLSSLTVVFPPNYRHDTLMIVNVEYPIIGCRTYIVKWGNGSGGSFTFGKSLIPPWRISGVIVTGEGKKRVELYLGTNVLGRKRGCRKVFLDVHQ